MISHLTGKIIHADTRFFIIDVNGVGYKIFTTAGVLEKQLPETVSFWTYLAVREDALDLYGFPTKDEMDFFELLLTVNGIGPKTALGILNVANPATIRKAVATEDPSYLTKVSGIGKKNAEKIVLELKSKLTGWEATEGEEQMFDDMAPSGRFNLILELYEGIGTRREDAEKVAKTNQDLPFAEQPHSVKTLLEGKEDMLKNYNPYK